jgi:hypothetical protein
LVLALEENGLGENMGVNVAQRWFFDAKDSADKGVLDVGAGWSRLRCGER